MTDNAELMAAVVRALPDVGTQVEYARAALDALRPLLTEDARHEVGAEAVNVLRLKDQRIAELVQDRDRLRVNVQHLRNVAQREIDAGFKVPGSFVATDIGRREALDDVLALMDRDDE